jgi:hypothetical protein
MSQAQAHQGSENHTQQKARSIERKFQDPRLPGIPRYAGTTEPTPGPAAARPAPSSQSLVKPADCHDQHNPCRADQSPGRSRVNRTPRSGPYHWAPAIGLEPITCRLTGGLYRRERSATTDHRHALNLHKGSSRAYRARLAGVPTCAGECRFVRGKPVGNAVSARTCGVSVGRGRERDRRAGEPRSRTLLTWQLDAV